MSISDYITSKMEKSSWIRKMFTAGLEMKKKYGKDNVFDLTLGNPVLEPPQEFFDEINKFSQRNNENLHGYMPNGGYQHVRQAIANKLNNEGIVKEIPWQNIIMSVGAGGGLNAVCKSLLNPGDEVIFPTPFFPEYFFYAENHGGIPKPFESDANFQIDINIMEKAITSKTKILILNTPNNPTGVIYKKEILEKVAELLREKSKEYGHTIYIISDEPYKDIYFTKEKPVSPIEVYENTLMVYSWSKSLSIAGDRIGYIAVHPEMKTDKIIEALGFSTRILGYVNAPAIMQNILPAILNKQTNLAEYERLKDIAVKGFTELGYEFIKPEGTFYIFPKSPIPNDIEFIDIAQKEKVLLVPGSGFGRKGYFRVALCTNEKVLRGMFEKLAKIKF